MKLAQRLAAEIEEEKSILFGETAMTFCGEPPAFCVCHRDDAAASEARRKRFTRLTTREEVREWTQMTEEGDHRPLKSAPGLRSGFVIEESDPERFYSLADSLYPAALATAFRYLDGEIDAVPFRETLERQTGIYESAKLISDQEANLIMRETCAKGCLRKIAWPIDDRCPVSRLGRLGHSIPMICTEACTFAVSHARRLAELKQGEEKNQ